MIRGPFNLRVYALIRRGAQLLLTRESYETHGFTKFPGGGVEPGEGLVDALARELKEELGLEAGNFSLYYVNDFYQPSAFDPSQQIISFYYMADIPDLPLPEEHTEWRGGLPYQMTFHWVEIDRLPEEELTFPIDRLVLNRLKSDQRMT